jgi:hypothetical protein
MKKQQFPISFFVLVGLFSALAIGLTYVQEPAPAGSVTAAEIGLGNGFTYQGHLKKDGQLIDGSCDLAFRLYDHPSVDSQVGKAITSTVTINSGEFKAHLDFGNVFSGGARWLGIRVKCAGDADFTDLGRQELYPAPYALYATSTGALQGRAITTTAPSIGQVLAWDGQSWSYAAAGSYYPFFRPQILDLTTANPDLSGFIGGFTDGYYGYFVPTHNGAWSGLVARVDLSNFTASGVSTLSRRR